MSELLAMKNINSQNNGYQISQYQEYKEKKPEAILERMLTRREAAEFLGFKENTLAVWATTNRYTIPIYKIGNNIRYKITDLQKFANIHPFAKPRAKASDIPVKQEPKKKPYLQKLFLKLAKFFG